MDDNSLVVIGPVHRPSLVGTAADFSTYRAEMKVHLMDGSSQFIRTEPCVP